MKVDITPLYSGVKDEIPLDSTYIVPNELYQSMDIKHIMPLYVSGRIFKNNLDEIIIDCHISGTFLLMDAISLEELSYPFQTSVKQNLQEFIQIYGNTLDIIEILWENIVLEVPMKVTEVNEFDKFCGDGWKLISEEEATHIHNPFYDLMKEDKE